MLPQSEFSKIENDVSLILNHASLKEAFQKEMTVYQERVFIDKKGARKVPDRISWNKSTNEAIVIDYKTGEEDSEHVAQINEYAHLIEASGMRCAKKYLIYTESKNVISC
jgi:CRISPR/Cas system-associated exonuclease Cas4 (RecB family)